MYWLMFSTKCERKLKNLRYHQKYKTNLIIERFINVYAISHIKQISNTHQAKLYEGRLAKHCTGQVPCSHNSCYIRPRGLITCYPQLSCAVNAVSLWQADNRVPKRFVSMLYPNNRLTRRFVSMLHANNRLPRRFGSIHHSTNNCGIHQIRSDVNLGMSF